MILHRSLLISIFPISDNRKYEGLASDVHWGPPVPVDDVPVAVVLPVVLRPGQINENNKK